MHSDQGENDHSDAEQHSGSERGHRDEDEDDEDRGHHSDAGSPGGSGMSGAGSPRSERGSAHSERRYKNTATWDVLINHVLLYQFLPNTLIHWHVVSLNQCS